MHSQSVEFLFGNQRQTALVRSCLAKAAVRCKVRKITVSIYQTSTVGNHFQVQVSTIEENTWTYMELNEEGEQKKLGMIWLHVGDI